MTHDRYETLESERLVQRFLEIALQQYEALENFETAKYNRLFEHKQKIVQELKGRAGDERRALLTLLDHENPQVRLMTAIAVRDIAPEAAIKAFHILSERNEYPQAANARLALSNMNQPWRVPPRDSTM